MKATSTLPFPPKIWGIFFLLTGIFSLISSLFAWGEGWLFSMTRLSSFLLPMADLLTTGPLSMISAYGILRKKHWGIPVALFTSGIYLFGSVLVFITLIWNGSPYPVQFVVPAVFATPVAGYEFMISWVSTRNRACHACCSRASSSGRISCNDRATTPAPGCCLSAGY